MSPRRALTATLLGAGAVALALAAARAPARADRLAEPRAQAPQPPARPDYDDRDPQSFWDHVRRPRHTLYVTLVAQARTLFGQHKYADAASLLTDALAIEADDPEPWFWLGLCEERADHYAACADALARADALVPGYQPEGYRDGYPTLAATAGYCLVAAGRPEEGLEYLVRALDAPALQPLDRARLTFNLGDALQTLGRLEEAITTYKKALELAEAPARYGNLAVIIRYALAVALDRDEQGARARDVMAEALAYDPQFRALRGQSGEVVTFFPAWDADYYFGLAHEVAWGTEDRRRICGQPGACRAKARLYYRRYVDRGAGSPWLARAKVHLADVSGASPSAAEIAATTGAPPADAKPYRDAVLAVAPRLAECLGGKPTVLFWVEIILPGKGAKPAPRPKVPVAGHGVGTGGAARKPVPRPEPQPVEKRVLVKTVEPGEADEAVRACVEREVGAIKWPAAAERAVTVTFPVAAP